MAYRFFIFKEKGIVSFLKVLCLILVGVSTYFVYTKQTKIYVALIIANLILITINFLLPKATSRNVENALKIKGNFILDSNNNGFMVNTTMSVFMKAIILTALICVLIAFLPIDLKERALTLKKYDGFLELFIFIIFYNMFIICNFFSNITLKRKQNKIFAHLQNGEISNNTRVIYNITIHEDKLYGLFLDKPTELLFDTNSSEFKYLVASIQRNSEINKEEVTRDNVYGGLNYDNSQNNF